MCKVNLDITKEENIDFLIYSTILSLNTEFTFDEILNSLNSENQSVCQNLCLNNRINIVLKNLMSESIIHDNYFNFVKMI